MAGFRKAKSMQAALKIGLYGPAGSGKTFTSLLIAEGLANASGKRIAYVDTERGTDFYCQRVPDRKVHPEAFDFDALYTRSLHEVITSIKGLSDNEYGVVIIDSITHLWEAARLAYSGRETKAGTIPFHAWARIKKPYKDLVSMLLSSQMHVIFCGRQGNEFEEDENGELKKVGTKMKAEGETAYEPHILIHMEPMKDQKTGLSTITAFAEKDRTGILAGKTIYNPTFQSLIGPLMPLLGETQAKMRSDDETAARDSEAFAQQELEREKRSAETLKKYKARFVTCES